MSEPARERLHLAAETLERDLRIDSLCSRFEAALKAGEQPDVANFLVNVPESLRGSLEVELRQVLNSFRASAGEHTEPSSFADTVVTAESRIGPYTLVEKLGEGGMGEVWAVKQEEPVKRVAALKFIKAGMDSRQVLARFEQERQALALLDHPNIARVLDGGLTPHLRPYFVMELVKGQPLTKFCDDNRFGISQRLELFVTICQAVQHAHQKGIVHRDLKPSNILVSLVDGKPLVKVIDFGVAKVLGDSLTNETLSTHPGMVVGTLEYMAPEQAGTSGVDIDTRADTYSLGVILYELLTGLRPFDGQRLRKVAFDELIRIVREEEPPRPSTRLSSDSSQPALTAARRTESKSLTALLRGDLDWIVMKCLEKNRARRYESASSLARDIERYLANEPVEARPPSAVYKVRKFVRRNKGPVLAGSLVLAALVAAIVGTTWGLIQAREAEAQAIAERNDKELARKEEERQRTEAQRQKVEAEQQKIAAEKQKIEAERQTAIADQARETAGKRLDQLQKGNDILIAIFKDLDILKIRAGTEPLEAILAKRLVTAGTQLDGEAVGDPRAVAKMQNSLAAALKRLGRTKDAIPLYEKARATTHAMYGPEHKDSLITTSNLALAYESAGYFDRVPPLVEELVDARKRLLGPENPKTLATMEQLARAYAAVGKHGSAVALYEETLKRRTSSQGPYHPDTLITMRRLAPVYQDAYDDIRAFSLLKETLALMQTHLGPTHAETLVSMSRLAEAHIKADQFGQAIPILEELIVLERKTLGEDHIEVAFTVANLATAYRRTGQHELAIPLDEQRLKSQKSVYGAEHPETLTAMFGLAESCRLAGKLDRALPLHEETLKLRKATLPLNHPDTLNSMNGVAVTCSDLGKHDVAVPLYEESLRLSKAHLGPDHSTTLNVVRNLSVAYRRTGQPDKEEALLAASFKELGAKLPKGNVTVFLAQDRLADCQLRLKRYVEAEQNLRECLVHFEERAPGQWATFDAQSMLGGALLGQQKLAEAESPLLQGYEGLKARENTIPQGFRAWRLAEAADRLIELYTALDKPAEVEKWRAERALYPEKPGEQPDASP